MSEARKLHVKSYGCQMNAYDSQRMADLLIAEGFVETAAAETAELVILNTCHIREKAAEKVYSELGRIRKWKASAAAEGRRMTIVVAGCVAYTRGAEISRPVEQIIAEVRHLARAGVREVTLIGQNVNAYHGAGPDGRAWTLGRLLQRVAELPGIARIRYTTSHPRDVDDSLIAAHRDLPQLMPYLHLPVQSGSDRVL